MIGDISKINLGEILGAIKAPSIQQLTFYIPNKDKNGRKIKHLSTWIKEAQKILTIIGGGSTMLPPADGTWLKKDIDSMNELKDEDIIWEKTIIIYTYVNPDRFEKNLKAFRKFLHRFGRETNQGEVAFEFSGEFFRISNYDSK